MDTKNMGKTYREDCNTLRSKFGRDYNKIKDSAMKHAKSIHERRSWNDLIGGKSIHFEVMGNGEDLLVVCGDVQFILSTNTWQTESLHNQLSHLMEKTEQDVAKGIKKYNKVGYKETSRGWSSNYTPIVVVGETEKSYRCAVVGEDKVASTFDPKDKYFKYCFTETHHANPKKPTGCIITIPKRDFDKYFTTEHCEIHDYAR